MNRDPLDAALDEVHQAMGAILDDVATMKKAVDEANAQRVTDENAAIAAIAYEDELLKRLAKRRKMIATLRDFVEGKSARTSGCATWVASVCGVIESHLADDADLASALVGNSVDEGSNGGFVDETLETSTWAVVMAIGAAVVNDLDEIERGASPTASAKTIEDASQCSWNPFNPAHEASERVGWLTTVPLMKKYKVASFVVEHVVAPLMAPRLADVTLSVDERKVAQRNVGFFASLLGSGALRNDATAADCPAFLALLDSLGGA